MDKTICLTFHNQGLRSYIEVDLCGECPRQDDKGCCGYYSPVFYPCDFAYLLKSKPELLEFIFNLPNLTVLDYSVTVNNSPEGNSYRCQFHSTESGCLLQQSLRESICRHFVCPGIDWEKEEILKPWKRFFDQLADYENKLNSVIGQKLTGKGLTLRNKADRNYFFQQLLILFEKETAELPEFFRQVPEAQKFYITRPLKFKTDWPL
ncbi:MAG: hypothetical protein GX808_10135 [Syntrophomonadaceae bacterium]|jgi:hypothetical protein|nr:hypothetical protein [Syntrophomonadaceae bacterium]